MIPIIDLLLVVGFSVVFSSYVIVTVKVVLPPASSMCDNSDVWKESSGDSSSCVCLKMIVSKTASIVPLFSIVIWYVILSPGFTILALNVAVVFVN